VEKDTMAQLPHASWLSPGVPRDGHHRCPFCRCCLVAGNRVFEFCIRDELILTACEACVLRIHHIATAEQIPVAHRALQLRGECRYCHYEMVDPEPGFVASSCDACHECTDNIITNAFFDQWRASGDEACFVLHG
jgi:hypothetical protein